MTFEEWWYKYSHELENPEFVSRENHRRMVEEVWNTAYLTGFTEGINMFELLDDEEDNS